MKRGKEISLNVPYEYNVISGTVDNKNPKSIYIQISAWGKPKTDREGEYDSILKQKSKKERVNFLISKEYRDRFKLLCQKNGLIMSVFIENAIRRFVDGR